MRQPRMRLAAVAGTIIFAITGGSYASFAQDATDPHYRAGLGLVERGLHDLAVPELELFLTTAPNSPDAASARYALAVCFLKLGRRADAIRELVQVLEVRDFPFAPDAIMLSAQCELDAGRAAQAILQLDRLAKDHADRAKEEPASLLRCEALVAAERTTEACDALRRALVQFPKSASSDRLAFLLGRSEAMRGQDAAAVEALAELRSKHPDSSYAAHAAIIEARSRLARGDASGANTALASVASPPIELADSFAYWTAASERRLGKHHAAAQRLAQAISSFPASPLLPDMLVEESASLVQLADHAAAEAAYRTLLERYPQHAAADRAAIGRGIELARLGRSADARQALEDAIAARPNLAPDLRAAAEDDLVEIAASENDWPAVERYARSLLKADDASPRAAELWLRLGMAQLKQSNPAARDSLERCVALAASNPAVRDAARTSLLALARRDGRSADAQRLLGDLAQSKPDALLELAASQDAAGDTAAAEESYRRFVRENPDSPQADEARARRALTLVALGRRAEFVSTVAEFSARIERLDPAVRSSVRFEHALAFAEAGRADDCANELTAITADAGATEWHTHAFVELGRRAYDAGRDADALEALTRARASLSSAPVSVQQALDERLTYLVGAAQLRSGASAASAETLASFAARFPQSSLRGSAQLMCGQAALAASKPSDAIAPLTAIVSLAASPDLVEPALLGLGQAQAALGHWSESEQALSQFLDRFPTSPHSLQSRFAIGWAREQRGEHSAAIEAYRQVATAGNGETSARAQFQIGECLFALSRLEDAVREFLKVDVLFAQPEWRSAALYEAGRCLASLGRTDDANRQFDDLLHRFPDSQWADPARKERGHLAVAPTES